MLVADAKKKGAQVVLGGERHPYGPHFYKPTLLSNVNLDMDISKQEIFGPVAPVIKFTTEDEVLNMANGVQVGLAGLRVS